MFASVPGTRLVVRYLDVETEWPDEAHVLSETAQGRVQVGGADRRKIGRIEEFGRQDRASPHSDQRIAGLGLDSVEQRVELVDRDPGTIAGEQVRRLAGTT